MIKKIEIKSIATFDSKGIEIDGLKSVNIIYGSNGTGKSTISRVLANPEVFSQCQIEWEDGTPMNILAYNKDFCEKNYSEQMPGVFTLGEAASEILSKISDKEKKLNDITTLRNGYEKDIRKQEEALVSENNIFRDAAWNDLLKNHESYFSKSSIGANTKDNFLAKLERAYEARYESSLSLETLKEKAALIFGTQPTRQDPLKIFSAEACLTIESDEIWQRTIVGKQDIDIAGLIMRLGSTDWVSQGVNYIEEGSDICPFCQQHTITPEFKEKINSFFDESYKLDILKLDSLISEYSKLSSSLTMEIDEVIHAQKLMDKPFIDIQSLESSLVTLKMAIISNSELMISKKKEPSRKISLTSTTDILNFINTLIKHANSAISENNRLVDNYINERNQLTKDIWNYFACSYSATIEAHNRKINGLDKSIKNLNEKTKDACIQHNAVKQELTILEKSVTSVTPTINEINRLLKGFGFTNFQIQEVPKNKNHYQIVRENGELATSTLSEGEKTFITFLYYMQLVKGSHSPEGISTNRVLVIDDPVSSLDSNILFVVSTLLRDVFTDIHGGKGSIKQIILLTHNVYFHKEVAFLDRHCRWRDCIKHWILRKRDNVSSVQAYGKKSPIKSSYELMWAELKSDALNSCIVTQNVMRRIIENYFQVFGGISPDVILEKFTNVEDKKICRSLLCWANDGSHSIPEDLFVELSDDQLDRNKEIFHQIFIQMGQEAHYDMMMQQADKEDESITK